MAYRHVLFVALLSFLSHIARHAREACARPHRAVWGRPMDHLRQKMGGLEMGWEGAACFEWLTVTGHTLFK